MEVIEQLSSSADLVGRCALTIGNFDGVHLGHQKLIRQTRDAAKRLAAPVLALMTFEPHPAAILHPEKTPRLLTPLPLKKHLLENLGVDSLIVLKDSFDLLNLSPADFVDQFLLKRVGPKVIVEGPNFNFGYGRSGNAQTLKDLGKSRGFEVVIVPAKEIGTDDKHFTCSSSSIRSCRDQGAVAKAKPALGRSYRLIGKSIKGRGIGTQLGFPTANIEPIEQIVPAEGVYAGFVQTADSLADACSPGWVRPAAISIGRAKTFVTDHPLLVEAHILEDNVENLTGKWLAMDFVKQIRHQQRFENKERLTAQIAKDCEQAKHILAG